MILVLGTIRIPAGSLSSTLPAMDAMLAASRAEPGSLDYAYALDVTDRGLIHIVERWRDRDSLTTHFQTPHLAAWRGEFARLGITDRSLRLHEVGEGEPI